MAIHHDKSAYGKLSPTSEEMSDEKILQMLALLNAEEVEVDENTSKDCDQTVKKEK